MVVWLCRRPCRASRMHPRTTKCRALMHETMRGHGDPRVSARFQDQPGYIDGNVPVVTSLVTIQGGSSIYILRTCRSTTIYGRSVTVTTLATTSVVYVSRRRRRLLRCGPDRGQRRSPPAAGDRGGDAYYVPTSALQPCFRPTHQPCPRCLPSCTVHGSPFNSCGAPTNRLNMP
jgi:hypothetical protein